MNVDRWELLKDLLHKALQLAAAERAAFLDAACGSDVALRSELDSLLKASGDIHTNFMERSPLAQLGGREPGMKPSATLEPGQVFAERYQLIRRLGEGGMGQVWLVEQTSPVRRLAALKLIRAGMYDESVLKRFQDERQSLAIMDHPTIAKVFEAGATPQGQPYFVMEYVPGLPITEYCDQKRLKLADRLELFRQACEGVQHAHQKAIIHRDLKPANILVIEVDGRPVPRIIDFGLAKATTPHAFGEPQFTQMGYLLGTPGYMSPEQIDPSAVDIDTRTDVYSLGAVLYVLLTGSQPFASEARERLPLDELLRKVRREEPPTPSVRISSDRETSRARAQSRGAEPRQLVRLLRGDLDWVTMKALEKDRDRRYGTPSELAADLGRYLRHEPVVARPASTINRVEKYVRRHTVGVAVAAVLILLLAGFAGLEAVQLRRITQERDRATRITDFMANMFQVSDPSEARGNSVTAREILDKASIDIGKGLAKDPEVQAQMMQVMSLTYFHLGLFDRAHDLGKRALDVERKVLGPGDPDTLKSMNQLGAILLRQGGFAEAERLEREALARERVALRPDDPLTLRTMDYLAIIMGQEGRTDQELELERAVVAAATRKLGADNPEVLRVSANLGKALCDQNRYAEAEQLFRRLLVLDRRVYGPDAPDTLVDEGNIGYALKAQGRYTEAEPYYRATLASQQRVLGSEHRDTTWTMNSLAELLIKEGRLAEADSMSRQILEIRTRTLGPEHFETVESKAVLAVVLSREGQVREAEQLQREALAAFQRIGGSEDSDTLETQSNLTRTLNYEGRYSEAEKLARETYAAQIRTIGLQDPLTVNTLQQLGVALAYDHRYAEAVELFHGAFAKDANASVRGNRFQIWYAFACVAAAANRPDDALEYLQEAVNRGYGDADSIVADTDLKILRDNPRFVSLIAKLRSPSAINR